MTAKKEEKVKRKSIAVTVVAVIIAGFAAFWFLSIRGCSKSVVKEIVWQKDNSIMVDVPASKFLMGSPETEGETDEHPRHKVYLSAYYIDKYEITNEQFAKFLNEYGKDTDANGNKMVYEHEMGIKRIIRSFHPAEGYEKYPVINVTWYGAIQYAKWAGKRLPAEAEWENAARAGSVSKYCFAEGDESKLGEYAWYGANSEYKTHPVGQKKPNDWGIFDMHGNAFEWCGDYYDKNYYKIFISRNPQGPKKGAARVLRGGSYSGDAGLCRSAFRYGYSPGISWSTFGFRCVVSAEKLKFR